MKRMLMVVLFLVVALPAVALSLDSKRQAVQAQFKSKDEPTAKDAVWTQQNIFKVGVIDTGRNRDGYADYVCNVIYEHGLKGSGISVQVIDIVQLVRKGKWVKLGSARCG